MDELAHTAADRSRERWQDVADVLHAGLDVVTTMNVAHLRSVRDYAARITGVGTVAWVPDAFVRSGSTPAQALADVARARVAATVVVGHHRSRLGELAHGLVAARLRRLLPEKAIEEVRKT